MITPIFANFDSPRAAVERFLTAIADRDRLALFDAMGTSDGSLDSSRAADRQLAGALLTFFGAQPPPRIAPIDDDWTILATVVVTLRCIASNGMEGPIPLEVVRFGREWKVAGLAGFDAVSAALEGLAPRRFDA